VLRSVPALLFIVVAGVLNLGDQAIGGPRSLRYRSLCCLLLNPGVLDNRCWRLLFAGVGGDTCLGSRRNSCRVSAGAHHSRAFTPRCGRFSILMQTLPTFRVSDPDHWVLFSDWVRLPGLISTVVFAMPAPIRLTQAGSRGGFQPRSGEVAHAFWGPRKFQLLWKVELPLRCADDLRRGHPVASMLSLSMVVVAALVGAGGLGGTGPSGPSTRYRWGPGFDAGLVIVFAGGVCWIGYSGRGIAV